MTFLRKFSTVLAVGALLLTACGDNGDDETVEASDDATDDTDDATDDVTDEPDAVDSHWSGYQGGDDGVLRVAFVYVSPTGDAGWTYEHDQGRQALEEAFGDRVQVTYVESVEEGSPAERVFEDLAREGNDLIFGTSFGYMDPMEAVAPNFPDVVFEHASGFKSLDNMGNYFGAMEEPRFLTGLVAGLTTEVDRIGYVAAFPIPEVIRGINAFTLGVREANPTATVEVVWTSTWYGPDLEKQAAESLLDRGVDVIAQHQDTPAPGQAADERGAWWVGYNSDMSRFAPEAWLTGPVWNWAPYYIETAEMVWDGTWEPRSVYGTMADGFVDMADLGPDVSDEAKDLVAARRQEIIDGSLAPFTGPLNDQDGDLRVEDGVEMTLDELLSIDWFVEGVVGSPTG